MTFSICYVFCFFSSVFQEFINDNGAKKSGSVYPPSFENDLDLNDYALLGNHLQELNHDSDRDTAKLPKMEKIFVTSEASQVDLVSSTILSECLAIVKANPEFQDLSYRVSSIIGLFPFIV